jgi:hypothetical protein
LIEDIEPRGSPYERAPDERDAFPLAVVSWEQGGSAIWAWRIGRCWFITDQATAFSA